MDIKIISNFLRFTRETVENYKKNLIYLHGYANALCDVCLNAEIEFKNNKNDIENIKLKKVTNKLKKISNALHDLVKDTKSRLK